MTTVVAPSVDTAVCILSAADAEESNVLVDISVATAELSADSIDVDE